MMKKALLLLALGATAVVVSATRFVVTRVANILSFHHFYF